MEGRRMKGVYEEKKEKDKKRNGGKERGEGELEKNLNEKYYEIRN
jgi:hypothetical protein